MSNHYYTTSGQPAHWQPKADGKGQTATTIRHARKLGLYPGVTTVLNILAKPGLEKWKIRQAVMAVTTAPDVPGENIDAKIERVLEVERQQDEESKIARDLGTEVHAAIESALKGEAVSPEMQRFTVPTLDAIKGLGDKCEVETVLVGEGYAGRCDCILKCVPADKGEVILDFKTCKNIPREQWPEHRLQLAAYGKARWLRYPDRGVKRMPVVGNVYISTTNPGEVRVFTLEPEDWFKDMIAFRDCLHLWQWTNEYWPTSMVVDIQKAE